MKVVDVAERFSSAFEQVRWHVASDASLHEASVLTLDSAKARQQLDWRPRTSIDQALRLTADAYRVLIGGGDIRATMSEQIATVTSSLAVEAHA
jgi:CDP-glucose 4,6-dehydratase